MTLRQVWVLRGPNIWSRGPVIEAWLGLEGDEGTGSTQEPGFRERYAGFLHAVARTRPGRKTALGVPDHDAGEAEVVARATLELQSVFEPALDSWRAWETTPEPGVARVVIPFREEALGKAALEEACGMIRAFRSGQPFDVEAMVGRINDLAYDVCLGPSTQAIVDAAQRGIPWCRLNEANLVMLGHGVKQRRILTAETDRTAAIAEAIAKDKELTRSMLRAIGVPVSEGRPVTDPDDAWEAATDLEGPVVVKPRDGNHGRGVALNLTTREQVVSAYEAALLEGEGVLVERFAPGSDHRLLVVGNKVVAAARREPPSVVGDGEATIADLVERTNADPLRGDGFVTPLKLIVLDDDALALLAEGGYRADSVPTAGVRVQVGRKINFFNGGSAVDVTERVHPEVSARAVEAARVVGLDVAGLDVVALDVSRPLEEQGGVVVEVNAGPGLQMHLPPSASPRPVGESIIEHMFPDGEDGRIPIVAVCGASGETTHTTRAIAHILRAAGLRTAMTSIEGIEFDGRRIKAGDCRGPLGARTVLLNPMVEAAVFETTRESIVTDGLGFDRCDAVVITSLKREDHPDLPATGGFEVETVLAGSVVTGGAVVLNADDPPGEAILQAVTDPVIFYTRLPGDHLADLRETRGIRAVRLSGDSIVLEEKPGERPFLVGRVPVSDPGRDGFGVEHALAGVAAAWAVGSRESIRDGLSSFVRTHLGPVQAGGEPSA